MIRQGLEFALFRLCIVRLYFRIIFQYIRTHVLLYPIVTVMRGGVGKTFVKSRRN